MNKLLKKIAIKDKLSLIVGIIISLFLSFSININLLINNNIEKFISSFTFNIIFILKVIVLAIPILLILFYLIKQINKITIKKDKKIDNKNIILYTFIGILVTGLLFVISHYPAVSMNDTLYVIKDPIGTSIQHPIVYNLGMGLLYRLLFKIIGSATISFFIMSILQLILVDIILTSMIYWYLKTFNNKLTTYLLSSYFIFIPIITNYNVTLLKDTLFSLSLLIQIPFLYEIIKSKGEVFKNKKFNLLFIIAFSICTLLRNNGLYVMIFLLLITLLIYRKHYKKILIIIISIILVNMIPNKISSFLTKSELFQEKVGIPIQQIAYTIKTDGKISKEDKKYLDSLMDINTWKENYDPYSVDAIKWHPDFKRHHLNDTKGQFINVWGNMLINNFEEYVKSYILATKHLWTIDKFELEQSRFLALPIEYPDAMKGYENLNNKRILPKSIHKILNNFYNETTIFINNGSLLWIMLFTGLYTLNSKKKELLILLVPLIGVWLTLMISAPISYALRYFISYAYLLPFIILIVKNEIKKI